MTNTTRCAPSGLKNGASTLQTRVHALSPDVGYRVALVLQSRVKSNVCKLFAVSSAHANGQKAKLPSWLDAMHNTPVKQVKHLLFIVKKQHLALLPPGV